MKRAATPIDRVAKNRCIAGVAEDELHTLDGCLGTINPDDAPAIRRQALGGRPADAGGRTRDDRRPPLLHPRMVPERVKRLTADEAQA